MYTISVVTLTLDQHIMHLVFGGWVCGYLRIGAVLIRPVCPSIFCHTLISAPPVSRGPGLVGGATWPISVGTRIPTSHVVYVVLLFGRGVAISVNASSHFTLLGQMGSCCQHSKVCRVLSHEFGVVRLYRTFSNYIFTWETRCVAGCLCTSSGWFKRIEPPRTF